MKLDKAITIKPSKYTDQNNFVVSPDPIHLEELNVIYINHPSAQMYYITIEHIPSKILLFQRDTYREDISIEEARARLLEMAEAVGGIQQMLQQTFPRTLEDEPYGPGSILHSMFSSLGIKSSPTCSCRQHALEMNIKGIEWCEENMDTILSWLKKESEARRIPWVESVARMVVNRAINKAKKYRDEQNEQG